MRHIYLNSFPTEPQSAKYGINQFSDLSQEEFRGKWTFCCVLLQKWISQLGHWNVSNVTEHLSYWISLECRVIVYMHLSMWDGIWGASFIHRSLPASNQRQSSCLLWTEHRGAPGQIWLEGQSSGGAGPEPTSSKAYADRWGMHHLAAVLKPPSDEMNGIWHLITMECFARKPLVVLHSLTDHSNIAAVQVFPLMAKVLSDGRRLTQY